MKKNKTYTETCWVCSNLISIVQNDLKWIKEREINARIKKKRKWVNNTAHAQNNVDAFKYSNYLYK